jgi:hypothetical protein
MKKIKPDFWVLVTSACLSLIPGTFYLISLENPAGKTVRSFRDRLIGITGVMGVDATARSHQYVSFVIATIIVFFSTFLLLNWLAQSVRRHGLSIRVKAETETISSLVILQAMGLIKFEVSRDPVILYIIILLFLLTLSCVILVLVKLYARLKEKTSLLSYLSDYRLLLMNFLVPILFVFAYKPLISNALVFEKVDFILYFTGVILLNMIFWRKLRNTSRSDADELRRRYSFFIAPLFLLPLIIPLSNELQYTLAGSGLTVDPRSLCLLLMLILLALAAGLSFSKSVQTHTFGRPSRLVCTVFFPCLLVAMVIYRYHFQILNIKPGEIHPLGLADSLHLGEVLPPFHQFIYFKNIPFIDLMPTHGLRDFLPQMLYYLANGYQGVNVVAWGWINYVIVYLILYFFLARVIDPLFSFFFLLLQPASATSYYGRAGFPSRGIEFGGAFFIAFLLLWFFRKKRGTISFTKFVCLWTALAILLFWRPDIGIASFVGAAFALTLASLEYRLDFIRRGLLSFLSVYGLLSVIMLVLVLIRHQSFSYLLINFFSFLSADIANTGALFKDYNSYVLIEYLLFPLIAVSYIVSSGYWAVTRRRLEPAQYALVTLAAFMLVHSIRLLHFHSMASHGFQFLLYSFLLSMLGFHFLLKKDYSKLLFAGAFSVFTLVSPEMNAGSLPGRQDFFSFVKWNASRDRICVKRSKQMVKFLKTNLSEGQTFYDFTSSTDLYVLTNKYFFSFFPSPLYYSSEPVQLELLKKFQLLHDDGKVPYVLFRSDTGYNSPIGVDMPYRCFRITEFIYKHYHPFDLVGGYEVWISNELAKSRCSPLFEEQRREEFKLGNLAYQWGSLDENDAVLKLPELAAFIEDEIMIAQQPQTFTLRSSVPNSSGNYIHLRVKAKEETTAYLGYDGSEDPNFTFTVRQSEQFLDYAIRASTQWGWMSQPVTRIRLSADKPILIQKGTIREGD